MSRGPRTSAEASTSNVGPVQLCTDGEYAVRKAVTGTDSRLVQREAALPVSPVAGQVVLDPTSGEMAFYDGSRSEWLSLRTCEMVFCTQAAASVAGTGLRLFQGKPSSANFGERLLWNATLVEITCSKDDNTTACDFDICYGPTTALTHSIVAGSYSNGNAAANVDFASGDSINVKIGAGTTLVGGGNIKLVFRRRIT